MSMANAIAERLAQTSRREQYLMAAFFAVALFAALWRLHDAVDGARSQLVVLSEQVAASGDGVDEELWNARATEAAAAAGAWRSASWQGPSFGVLSAEIQARLMAIGAEAGVSGMVIEVDPAPLEIGSVSVLRFRFSGSALYRTSMPEFLAQVAGNDRRLLLDEASIDIGSEGPGRVTVSGLAPIILEQAAAQDASQP
jgi:hypothetical protein